jgi:hypothetical protein
LEGVTAIDTYVKSAPAWSPKHDTMTIMNMRSMTNRLHAFIIVISLGIVP